MKLFYLFDYRDSWLFRILKSRKKPYEPDINIRYPKLLSSNGITQEQYPEYDE